MGKLQSVISQFDESITKEKIEIHGELGARIRGKKTVLVAGRKGYVYVRLRTNQSEVIQAINNKVSNEYKLPVIVIRSNGKYMVDRRDTDRYTTWEDDSSYIPKHSKTHSFDVQSGLIGSDPAWIYPQQFTPSLVSPFGVIGAENVFIFPYAYYKDGDWHYSGNTGTSSILQHTADAGQTLALVSIELSTGNPKLFISSGTFIPSSATGTSSLVQYLPNINPALYVPLAFVSSDTGTHSIGWSNIHDVRPFFGGGGGIVSVNGEGNYSDLNFDAYISASGSSAYIRFPSSMDSVLFDVPGRLATGTSVSNLYMITKPTTINQIGMYVDYLGVSGTTKVDVNLIRSGTSTSIFTTQANRPTLQYNSSTGWILASPDITSFGLGDVLELDIDSVSNLSDNLVVSKLVTGTSSAGSSSSAIGQMVSMTTLQTRTQGIYSAVASGDGTVLTPLNIVMTPNKAGNKVILEWVINCEMYMESGFIVTRNGTRLGHTTDGSNNRWAVIAAGTYDGDNDSTPTNIVVKIVDEDSLSVETTYSVLVRATSATVTNLYLNRTQSSTGADGYEAMLSTGQAMEIST